MSHVSHDMADYEVDCPDYEDSGPCQMDSGPSGLRDRWTVVWCLRYGRLMGRVAAAHGNPQQMHILEQEAEPEACACVCMCVCVCVHVCVCVYIIANINLAACDGLCVLCVRETVCVCEGERACVCICVHVCACVSR